MKTSEWTAALRSGDYEQCQDVLNDGGGFCCLGVLCEIAGLEKQPSKTFGEAAVSYVFPTEGTPRIDDSSIPLSHQQTIVEDLDLRLEVPGMIYAGEDREEGITFEAGSLHNRLMMMNDECLSFKTIADYIDEVANGQR